MAQGKPMDRLICGDVGYGKTEVAIRAAFKAVDAGKQVAVLVPTTILAEQHHRSFSARMAEFPFTIEAVNRFRPKPEIREVLKRAAAGERRYPDRHPPDLAERRRLQRPGPGDYRRGAAVRRRRQRVAEELADDRRRPDPLRHADSAHAAHEPAWESATSPTSRPRRPTARPSRPASPGSTARSSSGPILRELNRDGQIYFVHNRVYDIMTIADLIQSIVPEARIGIGHGQMHGEELEKTMLAFIKRKFDILVATTIIESGLDIPNVNTIFINEADKYGLADLHQLRGRVGRYKHRAYAYLLLESDKSVTPNAVKRLKAIEEFTALGAGFKIALRDLEIRGAGNILGAEQSGHIESVGYELYCSLLESAARSLDQPARKAALRLLGRTGLAGLSAPRLRARGPHQARALSPAGPAAHAQSSCRLPPGDDRPLRPPAPPRRKPADRDRDSHHGRRVEARAHSRRDRGNTSC